MAEWTPSEAALKLAESPPPAGAWLDIFLADETISFAGGDVTITHNETGAVWVKSKSQGGADG